MHGSCHVPGSGAFMGLVLVLWIVYAAVTLLHTMTPGYSKQEMLRLRDVCKHKHIDLQTLLLLRQHGICARKSTHRGQRPKSADSQYTGHTELCLLNCQSVCNKTEMIVDYITEKKVDILGLTETWLCEGEKHSNVVADLVPNGYDIVNVPRPTHGGGVAVIYRSSYKCAPLLSFKAVSFESVTCELRRGNDALKLAVIYRPPTTANTSEGSFWDEFADFVSAFTLTGKNAVIIGDFNFHMDKPGDRDVKRLNDVLSTAGLRQHVTDPTHTCGHILDLVISDSSEDIISSAQVGHYIADHAAVHCCLQLSKPPLPTKELVYRKTKSIDHAMFAQDLRESPLLQSPALTLDDLITQYNTVLSDILNKHAPLKMRIVKAKPSNVWHNEDIIQARKICRRQERCWRRTKSESDRILFQEKREAFKITLKTSKCKYYSERISECKDQRDLFRVTDEILHQKGKSKLPSYTDTSQLADQFNNFFSDKIKRIRENLDSAISTSRSQPNVMTPKAPSMDVFAPLTSEDTEQIIKKSPSKSCTMDPIPTWLLKKHISILSPVITKIVNMSLEQGTVPPDLKRALVSPLIKKPSLDCEQHKNYRPVSNLTFISKVIERAVDAQLAAHMEQHCLFRPMQSAYRKFHGTESALVKVQNDLLMALDRRKGAFLVLLDLSSAFDTIDHKILLSRLINDIGVNGTVLKWVQSYVSDRYQSVTIGGAVSSPRKLEYGVPQGSVLGPKLFTIYAAPLADICEEHGVPAHMYADDSQLYLWFDLQPNGTEDVVRQQMELCVQSILHWATANKLKLNEDKTELLVLCTPHQRKKVTLSSLTVGSVTVKAADVVRDLGANFDEHLQMDTHVSAVCQSAYTQLRKICRIRSVLTQESAKTLVTSLVLSRLDNGNALLANISKDLLQRLQRVQNAAARCIMGLRKRDPVSEARAKLHWLPIRERIHFKLLLLTWKALNGEAPSYIRDMLRTKEQVRQLRSSHNSQLEVPRTNLKTYGDRAFSVQAPKLWNSLPNSIKLMKTRDSFKKALKTHLFQSAFDRTHSD